MQLGLVIDASRVCILIATTGSHFISLSFFPHAVEAPIHCLWDRHQQEIRHDHHGLHFRQHVDNDFRSLSPEQDVEFCFGQP